PLGQITKELELPGCQRLSYRDRSARFGVIGFHLDRLVGGIADWDGLSDPAERTSFRGAESGQPLDRGFESGDHLARRRVLGNKTIRAGSEHGADHLGVRSTLKAMIGRELETWR